MTLPGDSSRHAAERAPATLAARLEEEWLADSLARPGPLSRLSFAVGCLWAATVIRWDGDLVTAAAMLARRVYNTDRQIGGKEWESNPPGTSDAPHRI